MTVAEELPGWSFNDETNTPSTRTAFSDMASTSANRKAFIDSLMRFMLVYGFDGADIDWEYPGADDRGGRPEDTANFVLLVMEMKKAFKGRYGISVTLPASFWYLQNYDVKGMEPHIDWFNVMTYDIHGVWDRENRFTGPYVRPHTNLTEIDEGLSLLWRAGISSGNVVLGLGWYGRSFKLTSASCTTPGCLFSEGAAPGECTRTSGVLSNAEIDRIIDQHSLTPTYDDEAGVNWITWDGDQWVSYDNEKSFSRKIEYANSLGLGGTMIWAIDQASSTGKTTDDYLGGIFLEQKSTFNGRGPSLSRKSLQEESFESDAQQQCYTSFCGKDCAAGYSPVSTMRGRVGDLGAATACTGKEVQSLCCASTIFLGRCRWSGWRGEGLSCQAGCVDGETELATNTNHYYNYPEQHFLEDQWCAGGSQSYCCNNVRPSPVLAADVDLLDSEDLESDPKALAKRSSPECAVFGALSGGVLAFFEIASLGTLTPLVAGGAVLSGLILTNICTKTATDKALTGAMMGYATRLSVKGGVKKPNPGKAKPNTKPGTKTNTQNGQKVYGRYAMKTYSNEVTCAITYTCEYGWGFDTVRV
jgi:chitinase